MDGLRIVEMLLPSALIFMPSHTVQRHISVKAQRIKRLGMERRVIFRNLLDTDAAYTAHCIREVVVDKLFFQSDRFKDLRSLVGLDRRYSHLGRDLDNSVNHRTVVVVYRSIIVLVQKPGLNELADGLMGQIRIDRTGAVSEKCCKMVHFPRLAALQYHGHGRPLLRAHQMLLQSGYCQKGRYRHVVLVHLPVRQNQDIRTFADHTVHFHEKVLDGLFKACIFIVGDRDLRYLEPLHLHVFNL